MLSKKIALLGANSHVGKGLISEIMHLRSEDYAAMALYARNPDELSAWIKAEFQFEKQVYHPDTFGQDRFDVVVNAIGVSDAAQIADVGSHVFDINRKYDERVMSYLDLFPTTKYIYISSGAVYGGEFDVPSTCDTQARVSLNTPLPMDWYGLAKLSSEIRHRSKRDLAIVDVRIFGYVSSWLPIDKPFFLSDIAKALVHQMPLRTDRTEFWRDYIGPTELAAAVLAVIDSPPINTSVDVYSLAPTLKTDLLNALAKHCSLVVEYGAENVSIKSAATYKSKYFSVDRRAEVFGYFPERTSEQVVLEELTKILHTSNLFSNGVP